MLEDLQWQHCCIVVSDGIGVVQARNKSWQILRQVLHRGRSNECKLDPPSNCFGQPMRLAISNLIVMGTQSSKSAGEDSATRTRRGKKAVMVIFRWHVHVF